MKDAREFYDRLKTDKEFAAEVADSIAAKRGAGATDAYETVISTAAEFGYTVTRSDIDDLKESQSDEISEEELGKVAGGTACVTWILVSVVTTISLEISLDKTLKD